MTSIASLLTKFSLLTVMLLSLVACGPSGEKLPATSLSAAEEASPLSQKSETTESISSLSTSTEKAPVISYLEASDSQLETLIHDNTQFALDLYREVGKESGNLFFSPYSISTVLAMTHLGSREKSAEEMAKALRFTLEQEEVAAAFLSHTQKLAQIEEKGDVAFTIANALWPHRDYAFLPEYQARNQHYFNVESTSLDYANASEAARKTINDWVEDQTAGKIKDLIAPNVLNALTRLVLTNAIYFKGAWMKPFSAEATREVPFHLDATLTKEVPMMYQTGTFRYAETELLQLVELPYRGGDLSMLILLPRAQNGLSELEEQLSVSNLKSWMDALETMETRLFLPKFTSTSQLSLVSALKALGMNDVFSAGANFSGMDGTRNLYLSEVVHQAFVSVDEEGTEAAAATAAIMGLRAMPRVVEFRADHPFLFLIQEHASGAVLFMGRMSDPS